MSKQHSITFATTGGKKKVDFVLAMRKNQEPQDSDKTEGLRTYHSFFPRSYSREGIIETNL